MLSNRLFLIMGFSQDMRSIVKDKRFFGADHKGGQYGKKIIYV